MDFTLRCNSLRCRTPLTERAVVTTCRHVFHRIQDKFKTLTEYLQPYILYRMLRFFRFDCGRWRQSTLPGMSNQSSKSWRRGVNATKPNRGLQNERSKRFDPKHYYGMCWSRTSILELSVYAGDVCFESVRKITICSWNKTAFTRNTSQNPWQISMPI